MDKKDKKYNKKRKQINIGKRILSSILILGLVAVMFPLLPIQATRVSDIIERDVVLVLDSSGSMSGEPMEQTTEASIKFVDTVFEQSSRIGIVSYDSASRIECDLEQDNNILKEKIAGLYAGGGTNMYSGLESADNMLQNSSAPKKIIVLMSDGCPNEGPTDDYGNYDTPLIEYANEMKNKGYLIYTLGFFSGLEADGEDIAYPQNLMEQIASPGLHFEVDSVDNLVYFFNDVADQISGKQYVYIKIACPVDVTVTSDGETLSSKAENENTRTSFGTLSYEKVQQEEQAGESEDESLGDISGDYETAYVNEDKVKVLRLDMEKTYDIEISGYDDGTMDYTVIYPDENGEYTDVRKFPNITVTATTKASANTEFSESSFLKVDSDGDGKYETTYETESNGTMKVVNKKLFWIICIGIGVGVLVIVIIVIVVIVNKSKKRKRIEGAIVGLFGGFEGQQYIIHTGETYVIGRSSNCDICILHRNSKISRQHCTVQLMSNGQYRVTDHSSNGTYNGSNNQKLPSGTPCTLPKGTLLVLGTPDNVIELR